MQPNYYAIIPANVRYDKRLTPTARLLYGEITALCNKEGFCWAKNDYFSNLYDVSNRTVIRWIGQLQELGYLVVEANKSENKRKISLVTKMSPPSDKNVTTSIYSINNTINIPTSGLNFVIKNFPIRFEQEFLMEFEKQFKNQDQFNSFLKDFNDEVEQKEKTFGPWLMGMLKKYARNWLKFQANKSSKVVDMMPTFKKIG